MLMHFVVLAEELVLRYAIICQLLVGHHFYN